MDPVCHTLVGAALAESGLKRTTALGTATLIIGANAPDIDALTYFFGDSLLWRRGWTHGVLALVVLPIVLTAVMLAWDRLVRRRRGRHPPQAARPALLLGLAALAVLTHPTLDWMNNYGMRWLMPFDGTWSYGDTLFIIDPWMWAALGLGVLVSRARVRRAVRPVSDAARPAQFALVLTLVYIIAMLVGSRYGRTLVLRDLAGHRQPAPTRLMVAPTFGNPFLKHVIVEVDGAYLTGTAHLVDGAVHLGRKPRSRATDHPAIEAATARPEARGIVGWARFPVYVVEERADAWLVHIDDARYAPPDGRSWAATDVAVPKPVTGAATTPSAAGPGS